MRPGASWTRGAAALALLALAACGAAAGPASTSGNTNRDPSFRDPSLSRSESYSPSREPDRMNKSGHKELKGK